MKSNVLLSLLAILTVCLITPREARSQETENLSKLLSYQDLITVDFLKHHLAPLAHDSMQGRETGTEGLRMAARYLADQYHRMGIPPAGDNDSYYQYFDLVASKADSTVFEVYKDTPSDVIDRSVESSGSVGNLFRSFGGRDSLSGDVVYAGFGIIDSARGVNHLDGLDLEGKWVLVFQEIPHVVDGDTLVDPAISTRSRYAEIVNRRGGEGILLIPATGQESFREMAARYRTNYGELSGMRLKYRDRGGSGRESKGYNVVSPELAARLMGLNEDETLESAYNSLVSDIALFTPRETAFGLTHTPYNTDVTVQTKNVAAFIEGSDPERKDEVVVLTSHYDHLGIGQPDSTGDRIYNGADDDGSGTVALLNVGKALAEARDNGITPRRSILLLHVSGEEKGLLGSRYYSDHPIYPIEKTVANINIDMIGRIDPRHNQKDIIDYTYIIGGKIISSDLDSLLNLANKRAGNLQLNNRYNDLSDPQQLYRRSDHWNFGRHGIPFAFFFTGLHEDYHRPSDEIGKIRFEKMAKIVRTIYATTVVIANENQAPGVDNQEFIEITRD